MQNNNDFQIDLGYFTHVFPFFNYLKNDPVLGKDFKIYKFIMIFWIISFISLISQVDLNLLGSMISILIFVDFHEVLITYFGFIFSLIVFILFLPILLIVLLQAILLYQNISPIIFLISLFALLIIYHSRFVKLSHKMNHGKLPIGDVVPYLHFFMFISLIGITDRILNMFTTFNLHPNLFLNTLFNNFLPYSYELKLGHGTNLLLLILLPSLFSYKLINRNNKFKRNEPVKGYELLFTVFIFNIGVIHLFIHLINEYIFKIKSYFIHLGKSHRKKEFIIATIFDYSLFLAKLETIFKSDGYIMLQDKFGTPIINIYGKSPGLSRGQPDVRLVYHDFNTDINFEIDKKNKSSEIFSKIKNLTNSTHQFDAFDIFPNLWNYLEIQSDTDRHINNFKIILNRDLAFFMGFCHTSSCIEIEKQLFLLNNSFDDKMTYVSKVSENFNELKIKFSCGDYSDIEEKIVRDKINMLSEKIKECIDMQKIEKLDNLLHSSIEICNYCQNLTGNIYDIEIKNDFSDYLNDNMNRFNELKKSSSRYTKNNVALLSNLNYKLKIVKKLIKKYIRFETNRNESENLVRQLKIICNGLDDDELIDLTIKTINIINNSNKH